MINFNSLTVRQNREINKMLDQATVETVFYLISFTAYSVYNSDWYDEDNDLLDEKSLFISIPQEQATLKLIFRQLMSIEWIQKPFSTVLSELNEIKTHVEGSRHTSRPKANASPRDKQLASYYRRFKKGYVRIEVKQTDFTEVQDLLLDAEKGRYNNESTLF